MKLTVELLNKKDMKFRIVEDYDTEGHCETVYGFWKTLWDIFMIAIYFMKKVRKIIKEED